MRKPFLILLLVGVSFLGFAQNADNLYLDLTNYSTIDEASGSGDTQGWNRDYVDNLYHYTEVNDINNPYAWLTMSVYGAASSAIHIPKAQKWIRPNFSTLDSYSNNWAKTPWDPRDIFLGSDAYFTNTTSRVIGNINNSLTHLVSFYVKNVTDVKLYAWNGSSSELSSYPTKLTIQECTIQDDRLILGNIKPFDYSSKRNAYITLSCSGLDVNTIYRVEASVTRGHLYEIAFKIPVVRHYSVNISQYGASTLYVDFPLEIPYSQYNNLEGVYYVKSADGGVANTEKLNDYIPANTGVIVQGAQGTYIFKEHIGMVDPVSGNLLRGSLMEITPEKALADANASSTSVVMTLAPGKNNDIGFYKFVGEKLKANMAYLIYDRGEQSSVNSLSISGLGEEFSSISNVNARIDDGAWYTLQGVRLNGAPQQRGIYIRNGKAVVVK